MAITNIKDFCDELSAFLETKFESIDVETVGSTARPKHSYDIAPQIGSFKIRRRKGRIRKKQTVSIQGTLISRQDALVPIAEYGLFTATSLLTLQVKEPMVDDIFDVVSKLVSSYHGTTQSFPAEPEVGAEDAATYFQITFDTPTIANLDQKSGVGTGAEIRLFVSATVYDKSVLGNAVEISIDGEAQYVLQGAIQVLRTYESDNVGDDDFVRNTAASQSILVTAKVAYRKTTVLKNLIADELSGNIEKTHTVTYSDGAGISHTSPKTMTMSLERFTNSFAPGEICAYDLVFVQAKDAETEPATSGGSGNGGSTTPDPYGGSDHDPIGS